MACLSLALRTSAANETLIEGARAKQLHAYEALMRQNNQRVFRICRSFVQTSEEALDVMAEVYETAFTNLDRLPPGKPFSAFVSRIAVSRGMLRSVRCGSTSAEAAPRKDSPCRIENAIDAIPQLPRTAFVMHFLEKMSPEEMAECLVSTTSGVKMRLYRARTGMKTVLADLEELSPGVYAFPWAQAAQLLQAVASRT